MLQANVQPEGCRSPCIEIERASQNVTPVVNVNQKCMREPIVHLGAFLASKHAPVTANVTFTCFCTSPPCNCISIYTQNEGDYYKTIYVCGGYGSLLACLASSMMRRMVSVASTWIRIRHSIYFGQVALSNGRQIRRGLQHNLCANCCITHLPASRRETSEVSTISSTQYTESLVC